MTRVIKVAHPTPQQFFDNALWGVREQNYQQSRRADGKCVYRHPGSTLRCAIGHSILDEVYDLIFEESSVNDVVATCWESEVDLSLIMDLQSAHDESAGCSPATFESDMKAIAQHYKLVYTPPPEELP